MYIKKITHKNKLDDGEIHEYYEWYLCDEKNEIGVSGSQKALELLEGEELGSYDYLFNQEMLFEWKRRGTTIELSYRLEANPKSWVREIKINKLLDDKD